MCSRMRDCYFPTFLASALRHAIQPLSTRPAMDLPLNSNSILHSLSPRAICCGKNIGINIANFTIYVIKSYYPAGSTAFFRYGSLGGRYTLLEWLQRKLDLRGAVALA